MTTRIALLLVTVTLVACGRERQRARKQEDIEKALATVPLDANTLPQKSKSTSLDLTLWLVEAQDAAETSVSPELADVVPLLEHLPGFGPRRYVMLDHVSTRTLEGTQSSVNGRLVKIDNKLDAQGDNVQLEVSLELRSPEPATGLQSTLQVPLDQAVILGDSTVAMPNSAAPSLVFYIVRVRRLDQPSS